jgi:hypothetical protein
MATLNFDAATVEPSQSFEPIPDGWYAVQITASETKPTKDGSGAYLELTLKVLEPPYTNRNLFYRLNIKNNNPVAQEIAYRQLSAICHATGVIQVADSQQLHGLPFKVKVTVRKDDSGKYDPTNEIKAVKNINEGTGAPSAPPVGFTTAPPPAQASIPGIPPAAPAAAGALPPWMVKK